MKLETLNVAISLPLLLGEGWGEGSQNGRRAGDEGATLTIAGFFLSRWERKKVRVRPLPNVAEILEA